MAGAVILTVPIIVVFFAGGEMARGRPDGGRREGLMRVHDPRDVSALVADGLAQRRTSGYDTARIAALVEPGAGSEDLQAWSDRVWTELELLPRSEGWADDEPEGAAAIEAALPGDGTASAHVDPEILLDRIHGAWLGRCAGCVLGKPLEGWPSADIERYLRLTDSGRRTTTSPR